MLVNECGGIVALTLARWRQWHLALTMCLKLAGTTGPNLSYTHLWWHTPRGGARAAWEKNAAYKAFHSCSCKSVLTAAPSFLSTDLLLSLGTAQTLFLRIRPGITRATAITTAQRF